MSRKYANELYDSTQWLIEEQALKEGVHRRHAYRLDGPHYDLITIVVWVTDEGAHHIFYEGPSTELASQAEQSANDRMREYKRKKEMDERP